MNKILITVSLILLLSFFIISNYYTNYEEYSNFIEHTHAIKHKHIDYGDGLYGIVTGDLNHYHGHNENIQKARAKEYCTTNIIDSYCYPFKEIILKKDQNCEDKCTEINGCNGYFTHNNKCFICNGKFRKNDGNYISNMNIKPDKKSRINKVSDLHICNWNNAHKSTCRLSENESSICNDCYNFHNSLNVGVNECKTICENKSDCKAFFIKKDSNNMDKCFLCDNFSDSCQTLNLTQDDKTKLTHECYYDENKEFDEFTEQPNDDIIINNDEDIEVDEDIELDEDIEVDEGDIEEENDCGYNKFTNSSGQCETCESCSIGKFNLNDCKNDKNTECEYCKEGTYKNFTGNQPCIECSTGPCPSGQIETRECNISGDRICRLCEAGTYKVTLSTGQELCTSCGDIKSACLEISRPYELQNIEWLKQGEHYGCNAYSKGICEREYNECDENGVCEQKTGKYYYDTDTWEWDI